MRFQTRLAPRCDHRSMTSALLVLPSVGRGTSMVAGRSRRTKSILFCTFLRKSTSWIHSPPYLTWCGISAPNSRMTQDHMLKIAPLMISAFLAACPGVASAQAGVRHAVDAVIRPLMRRDGIPGMAVGVVVDGHARVFDYGVVSLRTRVPVRPDTLFEIGSASKTFTATLASYAVVTGHMALSEAVSRYFRSLRGTPFGDQVSLLNLVTHTPGGIPLQVPADVHTRSELIRYLRAWRPRYAPGTYRTYSNIGIGLLGVAAARSLHQRFAIVMQKDLLPTLGLNHTFVVVPAAMKANYAQGYTGSGRPVRLTPGVPLAGGLRHQNDGRGHGAIPGNQHGDDSCRSRCAARRVRHPYRVFQSRCTHAGHDLGAISVSGRAGAAVGGKRTGHAIRCGASQGAPTAAVAAGECVAQKDGLDPRIFDLRDLYSGAKVRGRPAVE